MRIVFMGTPEFAVASLKSLHESEYEVVGVITATDKYGGRGKKKLIESAVKKYAIAEGLPVLQPKNLKNKDFQAELRALNADLQVVVAFRMLPVAVWDMPPIGTINLHGSLLPAYRGAAPIHWAVINGETETGVTTFFLQHEIDTGDILLQEKMAIGPDETTGDVHDRMMTMGAEVILKSVDLIAKGNYKLSPQDDSKVSKAPKLHHDTSKIDFGKTRLSVHNHIRGLSPFPVAWTKLDGENFKIYGAKLLSEGFKLAPGELKKFEKNRLAVGCADGLLELLRVQPAGKRQMSVLDFLNGYDLKEKTILGIKKIKMGKYPIEKTEEEWRKLLSPEAYRVLREKGTERAFVGELTDTETKGTYVCGGCATPLFDSTQKYHSGCGWPSFWTELDNANIEQISDNSHGMKRTELVCSSCGGHLGHIFNDGPPPTRTRYCINSISLKFKASPEINA